MSFDLWLSEPYDYDRYGLHDTREDDQPDDEPPPDVVDLDNRIDAGELAELGYLDLGGEA